MFFSLWACRGTHQPTVQGICGPFSLGEGVWGRKLTICLLRVRNKLYVLSPTHICVADCLVKQVLGIQRFVHLHVLPRLRKCDTIGL
jgi:hypothetical protein